MKGLMNFEIIYFVHKECGPNWRLERKIFPMYDLVAVIDGNARYNIDGKEYKVKSGDLILVRPGSFREATTTGMICIVFDFVLKSGEIDLPVVSRYERTEELERLIRDFQYEWLQRDEGHETKCGALFILILNMFIYGSRKAEANPHVEKIKRYLVEHYNKQVSVKELAEMTGLSTVYCGGLFRRTQGVTITEYSNRIKALKASALLAEGGCSVTEVAEICGFSDVYYFSRSFKKIMGMSPSIYKSNCAGVTREQLAKLIDSRQQLLPLK